MTLSPGTQLGPYEILSPIGAGGMGEVYLARDTKLDRDVALKVLPDAFARDKERVARFKREAKVLASLNHPNIGAIYGFEESDGECCLVLEYVKGETLAARLDRGPLPADEALDVARQIAEALEGAHEIGVIHRDLKPANVMLRADGVVKVLDFGLAKAMAEESSGPTGADSPTITANYTRPGVVLGTAAYMSPEQARGRSLDKRTDIWSFGVVLFECFSGRRPFEGDTTSDLVARILEREPDWTALPAATPPLIQLLLRRCLAKDHKRRLRDIGDARVDIESALDDPTTSGLLLAQHALAANSGRQTRRVALLAAMLAVFGVVMTVAYVRRGATENRVFRAIIPAPENTSFVSVGSGPRAGGPVSVSPDGTQLAFVARNAKGREQLWIRPLDAETPRALPNTDNALYPFWSADSRSIGFFADGKLKRIDAAGGPPVSVCDAPSGRGGTWNAQGVIVFAPASKGPLHRVSAAGGRSTPVTAFDEAAKEDTHRWPFFLPDGRHFLYFLWHTDKTMGRERDSIMLGSLDERVGTRLLTATSNAVYASDHVLFLHEGALMARPFDTKRLKFTGNALPVAKQVQYDHSFWHGVFSASTNGVLVYQTGSAAERTQLMWIGRDGTEIGTVGDRANHFAPVISPDGKLA
ncbi:MAG: serine/threonine-protein kinase, partial [Planctomycetes bacterium]|nr:serine/threonine-protein kinase [Planctomycetota bacterium]